MKSSKTPKEVEHHIHKILQLVMRSSRFFLSATALTAIASLITTSPMIETVAQLATSRALIANNLVKRQLATPWL